MVISVYEKEKLDRLKDKKIVIETIYYNPNTSSDEVYVRSTDGKMNDTIKYKAIKEKRYFLKDECIFVEKNFDKNTLYNIVNYDNEDEIIECTNCGHSGKIIDLIDGCPYCKTIFNFGANDINHTKKQFEYQFHSKDNRLIMIKTYIFNALISFIFFLIIKMNIIDALMFAIAISFFFSTMPITFMVILNNLKGQNENPNYGYEIYENVMWKSSKNEQIFYNNLKAELMIKLYEQENLIDFEILDYLNIDFISEEEIIITCKVREVYYTSKISSYDNIYKIKLHYNHIKNKGATNCLGCGKSIDISHKKCDYCKRINDSNNEWIMDNIEKQ